MATVSEHIKQLFGGFNIPLNDAALAEIGQGIDMTADYTSENHSEAMVAILKFAPILMLSPASYTVSEGGMSESVSFDRKDFLRWYGMMCKRYGVIDELNTEKPRIKFL